MLHFDHNIGFEKNAIFRRNIVENRRKLCFCENFTKNGAFAKNIVEKVRFAKNIAEKVDFY
jgi:thermostable 8-oxoguanine DNA glycosylase